MCHEEETATEVGLGPQLPPPQPADLELHPWVNSGGSRAMKGLGSLKEELMRQTEVLLIGEDLAMSTDPLGPSAER